MQRMTFGLMETNLNSTIYMDVPNVIAQRARADKKGSLLKALEDNLVSSNNVRPDAERLFLNLKLAAKGDRGNKLSNLGRIASAVCGVLQAVGPQEGDSMLRLRFPEKPANGGTLHELGAAFMWPALSDGAVEEIASRQMRKVARSLNYLRDVKYNTGYEEVLETNIWAATRRATGVQLRVNQDGSGLHSNPGTFQPPSPFNQIQELSPTNLDSRDKLFVSMAGAIAVAHASRMV